VCDGDHDDCTGVTTLVTDLTNGEVLAFCPPLLVGWAAALLQQLGWSVYEPAPQGPVAPQDGRREGEPASDPARPKSGRQGPPEVPEALTASESPFTDPTPDDS